MALFHMKTRVCLKYFLNDCRFNGKVRSSNQDSFNQPIKHALYKTLVLSFHFPTTTSDGISCLLLLAVTLYCKNKSCA